MNTSAAHYSVVGSLPLRHRDSHGCDGRCVAHVAFYFPISAQHSPPRKHLFIQLDFMYILPRSFPVHFLSGGFLLPSPAPFIVIYSFFRHSQNQDVAPAPLHTQTHSRARARTHTHTQTHKHTHTHTHTFFLPRRHCRDFDVGLPLSHRRCITGLFQDVDMLSQGA